MLGFINISGARNLYRPILTTSPSGSLYSLTIARVLLLVDAGLKGHLFIHSDVTRDKAKLLFYLSHCLKVRRTVESVPSLMHQLQQVVGHMPARNLKPFEAGLDDIAIEHRDDVGDSVATI